jgi:hypothetical protein
MKTLTQRYWCWYQRVAYYSPTVPESHLERLQSRHRIYWRGCVGGSSNKMIDGMVGGDSLSLATGISAGNSRWVSYLRV